VIRKETILVGSRWSEPSTAETLEVRSPITEEPVGTVPVAAPADVDRAVASARRAVEDGPWPHLAVPERAAYLRRIQAFLRNRIEEAAHLQIDEMGSPYSFVRYGTEAVLGWIPLEAKAMERIETREVRDGFSGKVVVTRRPVGVIAAVIPWNAPISTVISKMLPPLLAGCPVIVKCAPETPLSVYLVAEAAIEAGLPEGVLSILAGGRELGEYLVTHPGVDRVSFTGSSAAGRRVAELCGGLLRGVTLELGGKSAAVLLDDLDLDRHVGAIIASSLPNNGQVCYATTRVLVPKSRSSEIVRRLVEQVGTMTVGDPHSSDTDLGAVVGARQRDRVEGYIKSGQDEGAKIALGGGRPDGLTTGWYVEPTIFIEVDSSMRIAREEIFGPVLCVQEYEDEDQAVAIANDSDYGLGGAVFTDDLQRGLTMAARIRTGTCKVNEAPPGGGGAPFGGVKSSGLGRERGREGHDSYFELSSITLPAGFEPL
jgi:aldehyde dehydrogenase (NAD+)